jgi:RNA polymerase sigma-70 factor, ECF subfamily
VSVANPTSAGEVFSLGDARDADDLAAVERCLAGEREAFAVLVHRHASGVFALCVRVAGLGLAEELTQETFARAYAKLAAFRRDAQLRHWLYRIALNLCRDYLKSGRAREEPEASFEANTRTSTADDPERRASNREALEALDAAIGRLPAKYRAAFVLKHFEGLPYEEMKLIVGMPVPALKVRVHRAREMLRRMLEEALGED